MNHDQIISDVMNGINPMATVPDSSAGLYHENTVEEAISKALARLSAEHEKEIKELKRQFALANAAADFSYQEARDLERRLAAQKATHGKPIQEINKQKDEIVEQRDALLKGMALNEAGKEEYISKSAVTEMIMKHCMCRDYHSIGGLSATCLDMLLEELGISPEHLQHDGQEEAQA